MFYEVISVLFRLCLSLKVASFWFSCKGNIFCITFEFSRPKKRAVAAPAGLTLRCFDTDSWIKTIISGESMRVWDLLRLSFSSGFSNLYTLECYGSNT